MEVVDHLQTRFAPFFKQEHIDFRVDIDPEAEWLYIDEEQMHQALFNLIDNASRYVVQNGKVEKWVELAVKTNPESDYVSIIVSDNALGIDDKDLAFIFERFYKSDPSREKEKQSGSGIGLSIVKSVVQLHKGQVNVHTKKGEGSQFIIKIPSSAASAYLN